MLKINSCQIRVKTLKFDFLIVFNSSDSSIVLQYTNLTMISGHPNYETTQSHRFADNSEWPQ